MAEEFRLCGPLKRVPLVIKMSVEMVSTSPGELWIMNTHEHVDQLHPPRKVGGCEMQFGAAKYAHPSRILSPTSVSAVAFFGSVG